MRLNPSASPESLLIWSDWYALEGCWRQDVIPRQAGLYQIRRAGLDGVDYIGQTGLGLRRRLAMLKGVYAAAMPYRDPHTAAPALWACRDDLGCDFEVSVCPVDGDTLWRKGLEALAIALYRRETGRSPAWDFGRMPRGYQISSGNNAKLVAAERRSRGG